MFIYHFIMIGMLGLFSLLWSGAFCCFTTQAVKQGSEGYGAAAVGSFVFAAACFIGLVTYWCNCMVPLLH